MLLDSVISLTNTFDQRAVLTEFAPECIKRGMLDTGCAVAKFCMDSNNYFFIYGVLLVSIPFIARWLILLVRWMDKRWYENTGERMLKLTVLDKRGWFVAGWDGIEDFQKWVMFLASFVCQVIGIIILYLIGTFNMLL